MQQMSQVNLATKKLFVIRPAYRPFISDRKITPPQSRPCKPGRRLLRYHNISRAVHIVGRSCQMAKKDTVTTRSNAALTSPPNLPSLPCNIHIHILDDTHVQQCLLPHPQHDHLILSLPTTIASASPCLHYPSIVVHMQPLTVQYTCPLPRLSLTPTSTTTGRGT